MDDTGPWTESDEPPMGFRWDPDHGGLVPDDAEQRLIDRIEELIDQSLAVTQIVATMRRERFCGRDGDLVTLGLVGHLIIRIQEMRRMAWEHGCCP
jgi:hypothetical protein